MKRKPFWHGHLILCCQDNTISNWSQKSSEGWWRYHHYCRTCGAHCVDSKIYTKEEWIAYLKGGKDG